MTKKERTKLQIRNELGIKNSRGNTWTGIRPVVFKDKRRTLIKKSIRKEMYA